MYQDVITQDELLSKLNSEKFRNKSFKALMGKNCMFDSISITYIIDKGYKWSIMYKEEYAPLNGIYVKSYEQNSNKEKYYSSPIGVKKSLMRFIGEYNNIEIFRKIR